MAKSMIQSPLARLISDAEAAILADWTRTMATGESRISGKEAQGQGKDLLHALGKAVGEGNVTDMRGPDFADVRDILAEFSRSRALQGFSPSETATFVFSLKSRHSSSASAARPRTPGRWSSRFGR
jgi:rsbT co-antagonist protein RsbR